ncbi:hypothetical protein N4G70_24510 [Streptomyces sp. ASQP_92]|nr:hypothetical protein [Streptomyces sp. ASQP_92]
MSLLYSSAPGRGRRRRVTPPPPPTPAATPEESVLQYADADPPIYQSLLRHWASRGRTLPGHRDQEWARIVSAPVWPGRGPTGVSASPDPRGGGR